MHPSLKVVYETHGGLDKTMHQDHRDQTGSFYTPFELALEVTKTAAVRRLSYLKDISADQARTVFEHPKESTEFSVACFETMLDWHVVDPAGGDGVFAMSWLDLLETLADAVGADPMRVAAAAKRMHVLDLQREPLERYRSLILERYGLSEAAVGTFSGDMTDTERLFECGFIESVSAQGGYDLVIGNPPYIGEKNNKALFDQAKSYPFGTAYYEKNMDFFYYFIHLGIDLLAEGGVLGFITTGYFLTADGASGLRRRMADKGSFTDMAKFQGGSIFKDAAGQSNVIFHYIKGIQGPCRYMEVGPKPKALPAHERWAGTKDVVILETAQIFSRVGNFYFSMHPGESQVIEEIEAACGQNLGDLLQVRQGIVSGFDKTPENGVFVLTPEEVQAAGIEPVLLVPFYKNSQVRRGKIDLDARYFMIYIPGEISDFESVFPNAFAHLNRFKEKLSRRREVVNGVRPWYALQWPRSAGMFEGPKILVPHRSSNNAFAYSDQPFYASADVYYLTIPETLEYVQSEPLEKKGYDPGQMSFWSSAVDTSASFKPEDLMALSLLLGTDLYEFWLRARGKRKGEALELYATPLRQIPLPGVDVESTHYRRIRSLAVEAFRSSGRMDEEDLRSEAGALLNEWLGLSNTSIRCIADFLREKRRF